jgi:hypothetical protein
MRLFSRLSRQQGLHQGVVDAGRLAIGSIHIKIAIFRLIDAFWLIYLDSKFDN